MFLDLGAGREDDPVMTCVAQLALPAPDRTRVHVLEFVGSGTGRWKGLVIPVSTSKIVLPNWAA